MAAGPAVTIRQRLRWMMLGLVPSVHAPGGDRADHDRHRAGAAAVDDAAGGCICSRSSGCSRPDGDRRDGRGRRWPCRAADADDLRPTSQAVVVDRRTPDHPLVRVACCATARWCSERPGRRHAWPEFYLWLAAGGAAGRVLAGMVAPMMFVPAHRIPAWPCSPCCGAPPPVPPDSISWKVRVSGAGDRRTRHQRGDGGILVARTGVAPAGCHRWFVLVPTRSAPRWWHRPRLVLPHVRDAGPPERDRGGTPRQHGRCGGAGPQLLRHALGAGFDRESQTLRLLSTARRFTDLQSLRVEHRGDPLSYYGPESPVAEWCCQPRVPPGAARRRCLASGAGVILRYARPDSAWTVYEIDPTIAAWPRTEVVLALGRRGGIAELVIGDGRVRSA